MSDNKTITYTGTNIVPKHERPTFAQKLRTALGIRNISAVYVGIAIFIIFSLWVPDTFLTDTTIRTLLSNNAVVVLAAVALVIPLAAGIINLAIGAQVGAASIFIGWLLVTQGWPMFPAIIACLISGAIIGFVTGVVIVYLKIQSFIATLAITSLLTAFITAISSGRQILGMPEEFATIGTGQLFGVAYPVYIMVIVCIILWYFLERTPVGRRIYAVGSNIDAARLSGISVNRILIGSLVVGGIVASLAGILLTARLANADPTIGPNYLLPAFTAAFLGSTQFGGRFNIWGTVISIYVLAMGIKGLQLGGAPIWITDAFNGAALLAAVALAVHQRTAKKRNTKSSV